jgi:hypothetical protein
VIGTTKTCCLPLFAERGLPRPRTSVTRASTLTAKPSLKAVVLPTASSSVPLSSCGPWASEPVANATRVPEISGAIAAPSSTGARTATGSLTTRTTLFADSTLEPLAGVAETIAGAVLSTRIPSRV